jgi:Rieske 2Fe-2S family protein
VEQEKPSPALQRLERTLPRRYYVDPEHYRRELEAFWLGSWLYACRAAELEPRDFRVIEVGDQSVIVTRTRERRLAAFHNVCRHRGALLCEGRQGRFAGDAIVCPYHGWTYSLDGSLVGARHQLPAADFRRQDFPLHRVAIAEWGGCVFVNLAGDGAPALDAALAGVRATLAHWPLAQLAVAERREWTVACNWKVYWENFSECFHCPGVHPELCRLVPIYGRGLQAPEEAAGQDGQPELPPAGLAAGAVTWSPDGRALGPAFPGLDDDERRRGHTFAVARPGWFAVAHADYVRLVRVLPRGPEATLLTAEWLFPPEVIAAPGFDRERAAAFGTRVMEQDARICELHQRGLRQQRFDTGVLVPQEYGVHDFQSWVRQGLGEPG